MDRNRVPRPSIRAWLLALAVVSVVPLAIYSAAVVDDLAGSRQALLERDVESRAVAVANDVARQLNDVETVLGVLSRSNNLRAGNFAGFRAEMERAQAVNPALLSISLIGQSGRQVVTTAVAVGQPMPPVDVPEVARLVFATGQTTLSAPFVGAASNELSVAIVVPVVASGRVVNCLLADMRIGLFSDRLRELKLPEQWIATVFDGEGTIVGRAMAPETFVGTRIPDELRQSIENGHAKVVDSFSKEGASIRTVVVDVPGWRWRVAVGAPTETVQAQLFDSLGAIVLAGIAATALAISCALYLSEMIARSLGTTMRASVVLRDGGEPPVSSTHIRELDEMGDTLATVASLQEKLKASEEQFRLLANSTSDLIARLDLEGRCLFVSAAVGRLLGYSEEELIGRSALEFVHPEEALALRQALSGVLGGEDAATVRFRWRRKDGEWVWVESAINAIRGDDTVTELVATTRDITAQKRVEDRLRLAGSVFAETSEAILVTDIDAVIVDVNPAFTDVTGYSREEAIGRNPSFLQSGHHDAGFFAEMWAALRQDGRWQGEILNRRKDGAVRPHQMTVSAIRDEAGRVIHYMGVFADVAERKREQERIEHLAYHDALTRLPNRVLLADRLDQALARAARMESLIAVCYLDLDAFKPVNDRYGHKAGDLVLRRVARCLEAGVRYEDTVARMGGDEFVLVLDVRSRAEWEGIVQRVMASIAEPCDIGEGRSATVTACVGVAVFPEDGRDAETLLHRADEALYAAKRRGPGKIVLYSEIADREPVAQPAA